MNNINDLDIAISMFTHAIDQVWEGYSDSEELLDQITLYLDHLITLKRANYKYPIGSFIKLRTDNGKLTTAQIIRHGSCGYIKNRPAYVVRYVKSKTINEFIKDHQIIGLDTVAYMKSKKKK